MLWVLEGPQFFISLVKHMQWVFGRRVSIPYFSGKTYVVGIQYKCLSFLFLWENICCGYSLEEPQMSLGKHMLWVFIRRASISYFSGKTYAVGIQ